MSEGVPYPELTKLLTVAELQDIREEILSLSEALKSVPSEYDASFQQKINRVLDITSEVEHHTRKLRNEIEEAQRLFKESVTDNQNAFHESLKQLFLDRYEQQLGFIERKIDGALSNKKGLGFAQTLTLALTTALVTGATIGGVFYVLAF
ncbi:hypothetical protein [Vibrio owensii]|uniref:hypothetical protein n=1 Tax=Vibrio owensii TaxID=696485 RepID=UPI0022DE1AD2|nr:hypothetical protein [Vibrio owensii]MDA0385568.1 hypothetical protein [Vibrio owensii]